MGAVVLNSVKHNIRPGDIRELISGSIPMVVAAISPEGGIMCIWMYEGQIGQAVFPEAVLKERS